MNPNFPDRLLARISGTRLHPRPKKRPAMPGAGRPKGSITIADRSMRCEGLLRPLTHEPGQRLIRVGKEDEGVGICAGLSYCNKRALLLMQYTGLLDSINAIRAVGVEYSLPICMMAGLLNKEPGVAPGQSKHYGVRVAGPILDAMGVAHHVIETDADVGLIRPAIEDAYARQRPVVLFIGGQPLP